LAKYQRGTNCREDCHIKLGDLLLREEGMRIAGVPVTATEIFQPQRD